MSTMQSDFYWGQTSELWDYYNKTGALQKKTYNKKGLPNCAHGSRTSRRRSARAFPRPPLTSHGGTRCVADYGATLHATSADGTDFSSRAH